MITEDPDRRAQVYAQVEERLRQQAPKEDLELLCAFTPVMFAEMPDSIALKLPTEAVVERIEAHFRFFAREMPPAIQLYRGLPGIHVSAQNPSEAEARATGGGSGLPLETTVVRTHTLDAPFIFESLKNYFSKAGLRVFSAVHPIFTVRRQWERVVGIAGPHEEGTREVYCQFQIERVDSKERLRRIEHEIFSVLKSVFLAVEDFPAMVCTLDDIAQRLQARAGDPEQVKSSREFLCWLADENYIFMGTARYEVGSDGVPVRVEDTVHGVFKDPTLLPVVFPGLLEEIEARIPPAPGVDHIVGLDYCKNAAALHHLDPIDYVVIREWDAAGTFSGATLLLGRFARGTFVQRADRIPVLREKVESILQASGALPNSHIYREIRATFNRLPLRELFYSDPASLKSIIDQIVFMMGDDEMAVHIRNGRGYIALLIAFSRLRYSYGVEESLTQAFARSFGPIHFHTSADCGAVSLIMFYFDAAGLDHPVDPEVVRRMTEPLVMTWEGRVASALEQEFGEREGRRLYNRWVRQESRSGLYREVTPPELVPDDIRHLENLESRLEVRVVPRTAESAMLHLYSMRALGLTGILSTLKNLGLTVVEEMRVPLTLPEGRKGYLYRLEIQAPPARLAHLQAGGERFIDALRAIDEERTTEDVLNGLILDAGLTWREIEVLRTLRNHLLQIRPHYNAETINSVLLRNSAAAAALFRSFASRFDPALTGDRQVAMQEGARGLQAALESVRLLADDEILRALDHLRSASLRTNFFQRPERPVFAIKIDSRKVEGMPSPRPMFEIYVHSRLLEGIHLRGGRVARGGIRWSDRHDDFRTEILGLMKTQMVKNSIIVPVGSKGGFVLKGNVPSQPALDAYVVDRYREFVSGLLDVTDNIVDGRVVHPPEVVRLDEDDPYLVVAADKGTAHLSNTANSVSNQYGFWLGDAFASGGSHGYDHKKVGITARGVWECVKHHFRNLGMDVQQQPFSVCGIGDMAGDVFGNGVLMSRATRLIAAFNHAHIFLDPDPDPATSYQERLRLFNLPRSSWRDYNVALISKGGGIFDRSDKAIPVSAEVRCALGIEADSVTGEEMIRRILLAQVDLLYNGGIGTYIKASNEENAHVGDHANDRVRVDGGKVRARVLAEGGNLGCTQLGRLEYWAAGGLSNTDAVDNSGGVDMSDHEVNIKILLDMLVKRGVIRGREERNRILAEMTDEVANLVLADNDNQARAITLDGLRSVAAYAEYAGFVEELVANGVVHRADADVPTRDDLLASPRRERGLPRPLLAVLLGYTKMWAFSLAMQGELPDSPLARRFLDDYFPKRLKDSFAEYFQDHALRREIVATGAVNYVVNNAGIMLIPRLMAAAKGEIGPVLAAYLAADRDAGAAELRLRVLQSGQTAKGEHELLVEIESALAAAARTRLAGDRVSDAGKVLAAVRARI